MLPFELCGQLAGRNHTASEKAHHLSCDPLTVRVANDLVRGAIVV